MKKTWRTAYQRSTTLLCVVLVLNLPVWSTGCEGTLGPMGAFLGGTHYVEITPDSALAAALSRTVFADASAVEIDPALGQFRFISPSSAHRLEGTFNPQEGVAAVTSLKIQSGTTAITAWLDSEKHIIAMDAGPGLRWERPAEWVSVSPVSTATDLDAYLAANSELVDFANQLDASGGSSGPTGPAGGPIDIPSGPNAKGLDNSQPTQAELSSILGLLVGILAVQTVAAHFPAVVFVLQIVVPLQGAMSVLNITPSTGNPSSTPQTSSGGQAFLEVENQLSSGEPIWVVALATDGTTGADMLSGQSIAVGGARTFAVLSGLRDVVIRVPNGATCTKEYVKQGINFVAGETQQVVLTDDDTSKLTPPGCGG